MIDLYFFPTPNGQKVSIMLEETGLPYRVKPIQITRGDQFQPEFLAINPNGKIPAIVDHEGPGGEPYALFESGAILIYLAEKTGRFLPVEPRARHHVIQWLMFQMGGIGPMLGQAHHFLRYAPERIPYAMERYTREAARLYRVLDQQLAQQEYLAGEYSIADMATYPWVAAHKHHEQKLEDYPHVWRWYQGLRERPAVRKGFEILLEQMPSQMDEQAQKHLFGLSLQTTKE